MMKTVKRICIGLLIVVGFLLFAEVIPEALRLKGKLTIDDSSTTAPLNVTERASAPNSPAANDIYMDDGSNTTSGGPGWRRYTGAGWEDVAADSGIAESLFDANTILKADSDNTPAALTIQEQRIIGRITSGVITGLTATEVRTLINVEDGADVTDATNVAAAGAIMDSDVSGNGVMIRTGAGTYTNRTITGTANEISVSDGDGVSGNPTIGIVDNPIFGGTDSIQVSGGTDAERNGSPVEGMLRKNSQQNILEYYNGSGWQDCTAGAGGGEANTASNQGSGTSIYYQKSGVDLQFNAIKSENNRIAVALDAGTHDVELTLTEANIDLNNCDNTSSNFKSTRTGIVRNIYFDAGAMVPRTTSGAATATTESSTNKIMNDLFDFDASTDEFVQVKLAMPDEWNLGTIKAKLFWTAASSSGDVVWGVQGIALSNDDAIDTAFGTAQTVTDTLTATGDVCVTAATSAITVGGTPALGDMVYIQIYRDADNGSDTLAADARLMGIQIQYTESSTEPSAW